MFMDLTKTLFITLILFPMSIFSQDEDLSEKDLLFSLQEELQTVLDWECSSNNPSQGKFINLKCELLSPKED